MVKVFFYRNPGYDTICANIYEEHNGRYYIAAPVELLFEEKGVKRGDVIKPTLTLHSEYHAIPLLKALAEGLAEFGIYPSTQQFTSGELKATKYHLEDMRKLTLGVTNEKPQGDAPQGKKDGT